MANKKVILGVAVLVFVAINAVIWLVWEPEPEPVAMLSQEEIELAKATETAYADLVTHIKIVDPNNEQVYLEDLQTCLDVSDVYLRADCVHTKALVHLRLTCEGVSTPLCP